MDLEPDSQESSDNESLYDILEDVTDESLTKLEFEELMEALDTPGL